MRDSKKYGIKILKVMGMIALGFSMYGCGEKKDTLKPITSNQEETINHEESIDKDSTSIGNQQVLDGIFNGELEKDIVIRVLENDTAIQLGYFDELINAFNEAYKEQGIAAIDANMDQYSNLEEDGPYGYGPDVLYQANDSIMKYVNGKHIYPLPVNKLEAYNQIPQTAWDAYKATVDGTEYIMGVPVNVQSGMLFYRKDMLPKDWETTWDDNKNGIPDMVETWSGMYQYSKELVNRGDGSYGYMKSLYDVYFSSGFLFSYGGYIFGENNTNPEVVGLHEGDAAVGANLLLNLASLMTEEAIDDSITINSYKKIADGTYFATMTTPDVYTLFIKELTLEYESQGMSKDEASALAVENLVVANVPELPKSGDLNDTTGERIPFVAMGGVNGYAISAYTKYPNAALAFVDFATRYEMVMKRHEILGIVPARSDAATEVGGVTKALFSRLESGNIVIMPSLREMAQVWTPGETFFQDLTKDAFRRIDKKFTSIEAIKGSLEGVSKQIHDAINILKSE